MRARLENAQKLTKLGALQPKIYLSPPEFTRCEAAIRSARVRRFGPAGPQIQLFSPFAGTNAGAEPPPVQPR